MPEKNKSTTLPSPNPPNSSPSLANNSSKRIRTHPRSHAPHILMMPRIKHSLQILRLQIPNQSNPPMPKRNTLIQQRNSSVSISSRISQLDQFSSPRPSHSGKSA